MMLVEYKCLDCGKTMEEMASEPEKFRVECIHCKSHNTEKINYSGFFTIKKGREKDQHAYKDEKFR